MPVLGDADPRSLAPELLLVALFMESGLVTNSIVSFCFCRAFWADKGPKPCLDCHFRNKAIVWCRFTWLKDTFKIVKDNKIVLMSRPGRGRVWDTPVHPSHLHNLGCRHTCRTRGCTASGCCTWTGRQSKWLEDSPFHLRCRNSRCHRRISTTEVCSAQNPRMWTANKKHKNIKSLSDCTQINSSWQNLVFFHKLFKSIKKKIKFSNGYPSRLVVCKTWFYLLLTKKVKNCTLDMN